MLGPGLLRGLAGRLGSFYSDVDIIYQPIQGLLHSGHDHFGRLDEFFESLADGQGHQTVNKAPDGQAYQLGIALGQVPFLHTFGDRRLEAIDGRVPRFPFATRAGDLFHGFAENEHQVIIFRVLHAEPDVILPHFMEAKQRVLDRSQAMVELLHFLEALVVETLENLVFIFEIKVYGGGAVLDEL